MTPGGAAERRPFTFDPANGVVFGELDVARCYRHRVPYSPALYERLLILAPRRERLLDLGCGPGKIARELAPRFAEVTAVDPSAAMLEAGQELNASHNISWLCGRAEDVVLDGRFDAIAIGTAVHWMQHEIVFPRMSEWLALDGVLAIIDSERSDNDSPWSPRWVEFLKTWLKRVGREYDPVNFAAAGRTYVRWMDVRGKESFIEDFRQPIEHFIACQHSTATFARAKMGGDLAAKFDAELDQALRPLSHDGWLEFRVRSNLTWGKPRRWEREKSEPEPERP
jgi:ubiquinone/menaquinone biosynthesis C-methylase UbiE